MKTLTIEWLNKCRCGNKLHTIKTARGNESALWDDDAVKCNSCGRGGVIQVYEGQARVLWETDEEMAEGKPMSTITKEFTKEQLIEHAQRHIEHDKWLKEKFGENHKTPATVELARIALASLEADAVAYVDPFAFHNFSVYRAGETDNKRMGREWMWANPDAGLIPVYTAPPAPVSVPEAEPVAYIFKHPAGRLFWALTDDSNKGQSDVMPVYSAPAPTFLPDEQHSERFGWNYEDWANHLGGRYQGNDPANYYEFGSFMAVAEMLRQFGNVQRKAGWNAYRTAMLQGADGALTNEDTKRVDELVMWIKRLAHSLRKLSPDSKLQSDAMDYLSRKGLIGVKDILR